MPPGAREGIGEGSLAWVGPPLGQPRAVYVTGVKVPGPGGTPLGL